MEQRAAYQNARVTAMPGFSTLAAGQAPLWDVASPLRVHIPLAKYDELRKRSIVSLHCHGVGACLSLHPDGSVIQLVKKSRFLFASDVQEV